jgi:type I restriction enzyme S subunit
MDKSKWEYKKLCDVALITMGQSPSSDSYNEEGKGLPFFQGNADFGVLHPKARVYCDAPQREAYENAILMSVRAPIGAINIANTHCCIGRGLCAISPNKRSLDLKYLYYFLISKNGYLNQQGTGSTFKSIGKKIVFDLSIPVPSIAEQQRISGEIGCLNEMIALKQEQLKEFDKLAQSIFYDMFGDPITNEKGWKLSKLGEIGELGRGVSKHRPRNAPELLGGNMPLIQTGDVANAEMYITEYNATYSELGVKQSKIWKAGTLCITIAATIGKCAILSFDACFPDSVVGFSTNEELTNNEYIFYIFMSLQKMLEQNAPAVAQKNINLAVLNALDIPLPPLALQQQFAEKIQAIEAQKELVKKSIAETQHLLDSRMDYFFD